MNAEKRHRRNFMKTAVSLFWKRLLVKWTAVLIVFAIAAVVALMVFR